MGLISRLRRVTSARVEQFLDSVEDPELMIPQLLAEMEDQVRAATNAEAKALGAVKNSQKKIDELKGRVARLSKGAELAVQHGEEDTAREALAAQLVAEGDMKRSEDMLVQAQASLTEATDARKQVQQSLEELRLKKDEILTRARLSKTQEKIQKTVSGPSQTSGSILDTVSRMENKVQEKESEIQVRREMNTGGSKPSLDKKLRDLESKSEVELRLEAIRNQAAKK